MVAYMDLDYSTKRPSSDHAALPLKLVNDFTSVYQIGDSQQLFECSSRQQLL